jgi:hypothetical protein
MKVLVPLHTLQTMLRESKVTREALLVCTIERNGEIHIAGLAKYLRKERRQSTLTKKVALLD